MSIGQKNDSFMDFIGDINVQLCAIVKSTKAESAYVANTIRTFDNSRHRKSVTNP